MKTWTKIFAFLLLGVRAASLSAADITDTYNTGDTLTATTLDNIKSAVNSKQDRVAGSCTGGESIAAIDADGSVTCDATVNDKQDRVTGSCAAGQAVVSINADGSVNCESTGDSGSGGGSGSYTVGASEDWTEAGGDHPGVVLDFTDFTVDAGQTLTLPSGLTIKTTGNFTNNGTIVVAPGQPAQVFDTAGSAAALVRQPGASWNFPGAPYEPEQMRAILQPGALAAEPGVPGNTFNNAGMGGGTLVIVAGGDIANNGDIQAGGEDAENVNDGTHCPFNSSCTIAADMDSADRGGSGGGAGGFVILAADGAITVGTIDVSGGDGSDGGNTQSTATSGGGGGGGGIVHLLAPDLGAINSAAVTLDGGAFGNSSSNSGACSGTIADQEADTACGITRNGGVGGSLGGRGGRGGAGSLGGTVSNCYITKANLGESLAGYTATGDADNDCHTALDGDAGYILETEHPAPSSLF